jgi:uncharacterized membrane protein
LIPWNVGAKTFTGGTNSFFVVKDLLSVLVPGIVVLGELWFLAASYGGVTNSASFVDAADSFSTVESILLSLVALSGAYVTGFLCREFAFLGLGLSRTTATTHQILQQIQMLDPRDPADEEGHRDEPLVTEIERVHPVLRAARQPLTQEAPVSEQLLLFGGHARSRGGPIDYAIFSYCKLWLRTQAPPLSVDHTEIELNVLAASVMPTLLVGFIAIISPGKADWALRVGIVTLVLAAVWMLVRAAINLRQRERFEAVRNICFDYMMRASVQSLSKSIDIQARPSPEAESD